MLKDKDEAENMVRKTYVKAYRFWDQFHKISNCQAYLFKTMINIFIREFRREPGSQAWTNSGDVAGQNLWSQSTKQEVNFDHVEAIFSKLSGADVRKMVMDLPDDFKLVIVLSWLEDFSYREMGFIAGIRLEVVKLRLYQGCQLIREEIYKLAMAERILVAVS
jgi:RNA polymerase sigma-70 factor (ECF subfamily)